MTRSPDVSEGLISKIQQVDFAESFKVRDIDGDGVLDICYVDQENQLKFLVSNNLIDNELTLVTLILNNCSYRLVD